MSDSCIICVETFNKRLRLKIKCQYCDFEACRTCCSKYILDESKIILSDDIKLM